MMLARMLQPSIPQAYAICLESGSFSPMNYFLGGRGMNELVLRIYSWYSGLSLYFFLCSSTPVTFIIRSVITTGLSNERYQYPEGMAMIKIPHHMAASPK